ncbi:hypothetical protein WME90_35545 [Sorangium sp. So ce375]|uniref:hypothetical protein n=1 Tax=Sorangium sp. So ce375 TaxID=3133306 RepID=UPI003F5BE44C
MGTTLDIAIGLVSVFFLLSVLCSAIYEALAGVLRLRALNLAQSIEIMLADRALDPLVKRSPGAPEAAAPEGNPLERVIKRALRGAIAFVRTRVMPGPYATPLATALRQHPLIKDLKYGWVGPSYIPSHAFVAALVDTLRYITSPERSALPLPQAGAAPPVPRPDAAGAPSPTAGAASAPSQQASDGVPPPPASAAPATGELAAAPSRDEDPLDELKRIIQSMPKESDLRRALATIVDSTVKDMREANIRLERWFNDAMDRAAGRYKRRAQLIISATALGLCVGFNVDSIRLARALSSDAVVRARLVATAQELAKTAPRAAPQAGGVDQQVDKQEDVLAALAEASSARSRLTGLDAEITWGVEAPKEKSASKLWKALEAILGEGAVGWIRGVLDRILTPGILITAAAASLGAPFWFDLLNKLVNLRTVGKSPEPYEPPKGDGPDKSVTR